MTRGAPGQPMPHRPARGVRARLATGAWSSLALSLSQLSLMGTSLVFSLALAYAGGLAAVGSTASAVLVFQLTCGVIQRSLSEATLLADSHEARRADLAQCQWSIAGALAGGFAGAVDHRHVRDRGAALEPFLRGDRRWGTGVPAPARHQ